jgi:threonine dehydrogenase-like Zn-dependent dehydrogenase
MKAWRTYGINDMRLEDVPIPEVRPGWLLARVKAFQPSITEIQRFWGISQRGLVAMQERLRTLGPFPFGHEVCAVVETVSDDCDLKEGDRIAYFHHAHQVAGSHYPGCFAEYVLLPIQAAARMDPAIPDIEGPALQPFSSCVHVVREANVKIGETVAIFGQGVMGMNITQLCHLAGAKQVIGVDVREQCLRTAEEVGADITINTSQQDPVQAILDLTGGKGADVAFECASGDPQVGLSGGKTLLDAIGITCLSGRLVQIAFFHDTITLDANILRTKRIKYIFPDEASRADMDIGIHLVAHGKVRFKPGITHVLHGIEKLPEAIDITAHKAQHNAINPAVVVVSA